MKARRQAAGGEHQAARRLTCRRASGQPLVGGRQDGENKVARGWRLSDEHQPGEAKKIEKRGIWKQKEAQKKKYQERKVVKGEKRQSENAKRIQNYWKRARRNQENAEESKKKENINYMKKNRKQWKKMKKEERGESRKRRLSLIVQYDTVYYRKQIL